MQAPICKSIKTLGFADHRAAISSRIREVRENLGWLGLELQAIEVYSRQLTVKGFSISPMNYKLWTMNCVPTVDCELFASVPRC